MSLRPERVDADHIRIPVRIDGLPVEHMVVIDRQDRASAWRRRRSLARSGSEHAGAESSGPHAPPSPHRFRLEQRPVRELQSFGGPAPPPGPPNL